MYHNTNDKTNNAIIKERNQINISIVHNVLPKQKHD